MEFVYLHVETDFIQIQTLQLVLLVKQTVIHAYQQVIV